MLFYSICLLISFCRMTWCVLPIIWIIHCWSFALLVSFCPYCFILFLLNVFNVLNAFDSKKNYFWRVIATQNTWVPLYSILTYQEFSNRPPHPPVYSTPPRLLSFEVLKNILEERLEDVLGTSLWRHDFWG